MCVFECFACVYVCVSHGWMPGIHKGQRDFLELELTDMLAIVWELNLEPRSSGKAASVLNN